MSPEPTIEELMRYAALLAWIMESPDEVNDVRETAVHVWRIELTVEAHERLQQFKSSEFRDG